MSSENVSTAEIKARDRAARQGEWLRRYNTLKSAASQASTNTSRLFGSKEFVKSRLGDFHPQISDTSVTGNSYKGYFNVVPLAKSTEGSSRLYIDLNVSSVHKSGTLTVERRYDGENQGKQSESIWLPEQATEEVLYLWPSEVDDSVP